MLQQTTVATVEPRFDTFIARFPSAQALAVATEEEVLAELSGLGYYRRFRALKKAAEMIVAEFDGLVPESQKALLSLPGIGHYTAAAIQAIAFNKPVAAVDGNVVRVITRLMALAGNFASPKEKQQIADLVVPMIPHGAAGDFLQALFDLGAGICKPQNPACDHCPVSSYCSAKALNRVAEFPELKPRARAEARDVHVALIVQGDAFLTVMRDESESRLQGFVELPEVWVGEAEDFRKDLGAKVAATTGLQGEVGEIVAEANHSITKYRLRCRLYRFEIDADDPANAAFKGEVYWVKRESNLKQHNPPITTTSRKLIQKLLKSAAAGQ